MFLRGTKRRSFKRQKKTPPQPLFKEGLHSFPLRRGTKGDVRTGRGNAAPLHPFTHTPIIPFTHNQLINKSTITLFSTALLLRIGMFIAIEANPAGFANRFISPDVLEYHRIAQNLANNGIFSDSPSAPHNPRLERTPLYPLFIAAHYLTGTYGGHLAIVFQILLSSLTGVLTYWIGRQWFSERIAFIAGIILACDYTGILYSNTFYSETLFTLLFLLHIYFLGKYVQSGQPFDTSAGSVQRRLRTSSSAVSSQLSALRHFGRLSAAQAQDKLFSGQSFGFAQDARQNSDLNIQSTIYNIQ